MEFPIYQVFSALVFKATPFSLEASGRIVARAFFFLSCVPLYSIAKSFGFRGRTALLPVVFFLASPLYLLWSRQFMNETVPIFFGLAYLAAVLIFTRTLSNANLLGVVFLGSLAALTKSTTYVTFAMASGLYLFWFLFFSGRKFSFSTFSKFGAALFVPLLVGLIWVKFSDGVKNQNPLASQLLSSSTWLSTWLGGGERWSGAFWNRLFRITIEDSIGHRAVWILSILFAFSLGRRAWLYWLCAILFIVAPSIFTHPHMTHDYYACANGVFLVFAIAALVERGLSAPQSWARNVAAILFVVTIGYEVREFLGKGYVQQQEVRMAPIDFGHKLQALVPPGQVLLMYGEDWCPVIPFYAERRAIMMVNEQWYNPNLAKSLNNLSAEKGHVAVTVLCHEARSDQKLLATIKLGPLLLRDLCDVYAE